MIVSQRLGGSYLRPHMARAIRFRPQGVRMSRAMMRSRTAARSSGVKSAKAQPPGTNDGAAAFTMASAATPHFSLMSGRSSSHRGIGWPLYAFQSACAP